MKFSLELLKFGKSKHSAAEDIAVINEESSPAPKMVSSTTKRLKSHGSELLLLISGLLGGAIVFGGLCGLTFIEEAPVKQLPKSIVDNVSFRNTSMVRESVTPFGDMGFVPVILPALPEMPQADKAQRDAIRIVGLMPPKMVILQQNGKRVTAMSGSETPIGKIGAITDKGCYIDGEFVKYK